VKSSKAVTRALDDLLGRGLIAAGVGDRDRCGAGRAVIDAPGEEVARR
jgi:hypothetical protein